MKRLAILALVLPGAALAADAPFCVVTGAGSQCYYWNAPSCQSAARSMQGMCVANQQQQPSQPVPNNYESWTRARENGARRAEQERKSGPAQQAPTKFSWDGFIKDLAYKQQMRGPIYDCGNGPTPVPAEGCTVTGFERDL